MIDIAVNNLHKYYGSNHVLSGITFEVYSGERVGLLGKNGSGKTTLFKVITGEEPYESGTVSKASRKKVEILSQIPVFEPNKTVEDILRSSFEETSHILRELQALEAHLDAPLLNRYGQLLEAYERLGGYETEVQLDKVCSGMNIDETIRKSYFHLLSGGEKTRINLARILLRNCDILLLDEPTNHLDLSSLEWLEKFLLDFPGTVIAISHDRVFLDNVITRIIEIDGGKVNFYSGNYSFYMEEREQRFLTQSEQYKQQQRKIDQLEAAIKQQRVWMQINPASTGLAKRALAMEKRIEQMDKVQKPITDRKLTAEFSGGGYASKEIILFDSVYKSYGTKEILSNLNFQLCRNDRIALVGANGCGKTTLIKMILNEEPCDSGTIKISTNSKPAYMSQMITFPDHNATVLDALRCESAISEQKARSILAGFHFKATDVNKKVSTLSGGEKSRLKLCLMMHNDTNLLLLDEPTNHLDIASREWLENALTDFKGTMLFVSHDRYFLNKFASKIWSIQDGVITEYNCGFEEYLQKISAVPAPSGKHKNKTSASLAPKEKTKRHTTSSVSPDQLIAEAEIELKELNKSIEVAVSNTNHAKTNQLYAAKKRLEEQIDFLYDEWIQNS